MTENVLNLEIFKGIDSEVVTEIILSSPEKNFPTGEIIILEGEESNGEGYIIKSGKVKVSIGGNKVVDLQEGNIFGEIALLNEEQRTATIEAIENTTVIVLTLDTLINLINNDGNKINKEIIRRIEENLNR